MWQILAGSIRCLCCHILQRVMASDSERPPRRSSPTGKYEEQCHVNQQSGHSILSATSKHICKIALHSTGRDQSTQFQSRQFWR